MKKQINLALIVAFALLYSSASLWSQGFTGAEYKKALWMTTRYYGGQRSGSNNWLLYNHLPSGLNAAYTGKSFMADNDAGYDLSGGWHDCGDHVKFGQTEFYSAYILLKGYGEFPTGYDDMYSANYAGYTSSGKYNYEETGHDPNGIPDILDEVKHATDYFIKCTKDASTFYFQVGRGDWDHAQWVTSVKMQTLAQSSGGDARPTYKNPSDASMPSFCGATLALMSRLYRKFDPAYADLCLTHAIYAYTYAKSHPGTVGSSNGGEYGANDNWKDDYSCLCAELYWATGTASYKTEAMNFTMADSPGSGGEIYGKNYGFDYTNNGDIAIYNLALLGKANAATVLASIISKHYFGNVQADGQFNGGNTGWGPLRYNANTAFIVALWQKLNNTQATPNKYIYDNIDYILGKNTASQSFIVGFGAKTPSHPHHRNYYLRDDNPNDAAKPSMTPPAKNLQFGSMVGGSRSPGTFSDNVVNYQHTEGGIDYNACLVGVLGYINSIKSPVDTNKFSPHKSPTLGSSQSICGVASILLNSNIATDTKKTFTWYKDAGIVSAASTTKNTYTVTSAGTYKCVVDSAGKWNTQGSVVITGTISKVALGADVALCNPATADLDMGVSGSGISYQWMRNGEVITGETSKTYTAYTAGTYKGIASASGCPSTTDTIVVTSSLPTAVFDTICTTGTASLSISGSGGPYEWYNNISTGSVLATGTSYAPSISSTTTYYVKDASSVSVSAGPSSSNNALANPTNAGVVGIRFTALKAFTITQIKVLPYVYSCNGDKVYVNFALKQGGSTLATYTSDQITCTGAQSGAPFNTYYTLTFSPAISIPAAGSYELTPSTGNALVWFDSGANFTTMDASGVIDITDDTRDDKANSFPGIVDIKIQGGSTCARTPVLAVIDAANDKCLSTGIENENSTINATVFPNPSSSTFNLKTAMQAKAHVLDHLGRLMYTFNTNTNTAFGEEFAPGIYHIILFNDEGVLNTLNMIKE